MAAQTGLNVNYRNPLLHRDQSTGKGRVDIPHDRHTGRLAVIHDRLEPPHHFSGLDGMRARPDLQVHIGLGQMKVFKQLTAHVLVVMLTGMQQQARQRGRVPSHGPQNGSDFHEVRPCPHDTNDRSQRTH